MNELFGSFFWASAVRLSAPMFLAAIGETVVQRAGMFNIGIEGMMLVGAFAGVAGAHDHRKYARRSRLGRPRDGGTRMRLRNPHRGLLGSIRS